MRGPSRPGHSRTSHRTNSCSPIGTLVPLRKSITDVLEHPEPLYLRSKLSKAHAKF